MDQATGPFRSYSQQA